MTYINRDLVQTKSKLEGNIKVFIFEIVINNNGMANERHFYFTDYKKRFIVFLALFKRLKLRILKTKLVLCFT